MLAITVSVSNSHSTNAKSPSLGLMNRFAPQLNVFILSMPIKSGACALLIIFYLGPFLDHQQFLFNLLNNVILSLRQFLG